MGSWGTHREMEEEKNGEGRRRQHSGRMGQHTYARAVHALVLLPHELIKVVYPEHDVLPANECSAGCLQLGEEDGKSFQRSLEGRWE